MLPGRITASGSLQFRRVADDPQPDVRLDPEGIEIGEVRDVGKIDDGDLHMVARGDAAVDQAVLEADRVLLGEAEVPQVRDDAEDRAPRVAKDVVVGVGEKRLLPAEAVDDETLHQGPFPFGEDLHRPDERGVDAAPVDVADDQDRCVGVKGHVHVHDVALLEVHLAGASRPFQDDRVVLGGERVEGLLRRGEGRDPVAGVLPEIHVSDRLSQDDHLGAGVAVGLEQHRVHPDVGIDPAGLGLDDLRPPHLAAVAGDVRVERHVLRLERGDPEAVLEEDPAERGGEDALARVRAGPLEHERGRSPGGGFACTAQHLPEGAAEAVVLFRRPDGDAEEPPVEAGEVVADADGDPVLEEAARQFGSGEAAPVDADQEEVRRSRIDGKPGDRFEFSGELLTPLADEAARLLCVFGIAERRRSDGLGEGVHRPGGRDGAEPPDDLPVGDDAAQAEARDGVELGERPQDDEISRPFLVQEALLRTKSAKASSMTKIVEGWRPARSRRVSAGRKWPVGLFGRPRKRTSSPRSAASISAMSGMKALSSRRGSVSTAIPADSAAAA